ncbi:RNA polymerase I associated factor, A49-like protein [Glomus cerebriforme]|uniref:RNA polymerase I associated factor, A49-like protein n=1 Tax=Glomus cerebriforme TaxID=658196 RepID=A0A397TPJ3_9GLOM|nr:RNA polymerase I associated factor, A49-like protein [Glomus cerebriforme]
MEEYSETNRGEKRKLEVILEVDKSSTEPAPFLGTFTGLSAAPKELLYQAYEKAAYKHRNVVGENEVVSLESTAQPSKTSEYLIAIYDKHSNTVTFRDASEIELAPVLKRLKAEQPEEPEPIKDYYTAKTALNKEFGSKKARLKIVNRERGEIDASQVQNLDKIAAEVDEKAKKKATDVEKQETMVEQNSIIPPYDAITTEPSKVYKLEDIITPAEFDAIDIQALLKAKTEKDRYALLPYSNSNYIKSRLIPSLTVKKVNHKRIKILMYINYMMAFRSHAFGNVRNRKSMAEGLGKPPNIILDKLYERFVDRTFAKIGGSESFKFTAKNDQKLICYMLVLCLKLDNNYVDPEPISEDLCITTTKLNILFKGIGCSIRTLSKKEMAELQITKEYSAKRAVLTAPIKIPEPKRGSQKKKISSN